MPFNDDAAAQVYPDSNALHGLGDVPAPWDPATGSFPGMPVEFAKELYDWLYGRNRNYNLGGFYIQDTNYYHDVVWANNATYILAFNAQKQTYVTNLPTAGFIEPNTAFVLDAISFRILEVSTAGALVDELIDDAAASTTVKTLIQYLQGGEVNMRVGQNRVLNHRGVDKFVPATGFQLSTNATTSATGLNLVRGSDGNDNTGYMLRSPMVILPTDSIDFAINFPGATAHGVSAGVPVRIELIGRSLRRRT